MASVVILLRHAEKPRDGSPARGVTIDGDPDPESLTPRGWQRAGALVGLFVQDPSEARSPRLPTPTHLFASRVGEGSSSRRPHETLLPLSERLGLDVDSRFRKEELDALVLAVQAIDGVVLIAWEHHLIPSLAKMLVGNASSVPQAWPDDRYDVAWVLEDAGQDGTRGFREVAEMVLAGDRPNPIGTASAA